MTEESKRASWAWIAFRDFLFSAGISLLIFFIWFFYQEKKPISEIIKDIQNLRFPQDYYIFAIVTGVIFFLSLLASRTKRWRNKAMILPGSRSVPGVIHIGKFEIKIENDLMLFKKNGFSRSGSWKERKSEYRGVSLSAEYIIEEGRGHGLGRLSGLFEEGYIKYFIQLLYLKQSKRIILYEKNINSNKEYLPIRKAWKETARALGLPAVEYLPLRSIQRGVQDLDKPIRVLAKKNRNSFDFKIDSHLPPHTKLLQTTEELTIIYRRGLLKKIKIIISPKLMKIGKIIIPFDEMQHIGLLHYEESGESYYTIVVASDSDVVRMTGLSSDQGFWIGELLLAGACGKPNIFRIKYESTIK